MRTLGVLLQWFYEIPHRKREPIMKRPRLRNQSTICQGRQQEAQSKSHPRINSLRYHPSHHQIDHYLVLEKYFTKYTVVFYYAFLCVPRNSTFSLIYLILLFVNCKYSLLISPLGILSKACEKSPTGSLNFLLKNKLIFHYSICLCF